jgi:hypothetical protein
MQVNECAAYIYATTCCDRQDDVSLFRNTTHRHRRLLHTQDNTFIHPREHPAAAELARLHGMDIQRISGKVETKRDIRMLSGSRRVVRRGTRYDANRRLLQFNNSRFCLFRWTAINSRILLLCSVLQFFLQTS